jgi:hypothetical protein
VAVVTVRSVNRAEEARDTVEKSFDGSRHRGTPLDGRRRAKTENRVVSQETDKRGSILRINGSKQAAGISTGGAA